MAEKETILIADDSFLVQELLREVLSKAGHKLTKSARSVGDVEEIVDSDTQFTLAFVDGAMPVFGDGEKAAAYIREHRPEVKIIAFSGDSQKYGDLNLRKDTPTSEILEKIKSL